MEFTTYAWKRLNITDLLRTESVDGDNFSRQAPSVHEAHRVEADLADECVVRHHHGHCAEQNLQMRNEGNYYENQRPALQFGGQRTLKGTTITAKIVGTAFQDDPQPHSMLVVWAQLGLWLAQEPILNRAEERATWNENSRPVDR